MVENEMLYCQNGECLAAAITQRGPNNWLLCLQCAAAYDVGHTDCGLPPSPNGRPLYYVSECPDTGQQFLVQYGVDNNIIELTLENVKIFGLIPFLVEQAEHYRAEILPLYPSPPHSLCDFESFDLARNEFLESLWDVIQEHFVGTRK